MDLVSTYLIHKDLYGFKIKKPPYLFSAIRPHGLILRNQGWSPALKPSFSYLINVLTTVIIKIPNSFEVNKKQK